MGNAQSSAVEPDAPRRQSRRQSHRLSKPMTGNHATAGLLSPGGFSNSTRRLSTVRMSFRPPPPSPASTPTTTANTSPTTASSFEAQSGPGQHHMERSASAVSIEQKESRTRSLFRSRSSQGTSDSSRRQRSTGPVSRVADRLGRTNSMTYESAVSYYGQTDPESWFPPPTFAPPISSRASWNYDLTSYEAKRLLNLTEEPLFEHATAMSENKTTVVTETTWKSSNPANAANATSAPISRVNSDLSLYMPVRRRSVIQKPGVATRSNSMRDDAMVSRPTVRYSHPPTPSLSRQTSFESYRGGVISMPPLLHDANIPRVLTPCEDNYQSIGAFKLGSLRITNGAASPGSPELERGRQRSDEDQGRPAAPDDYFDRPALNATSSKPPSTPPKPETLQPRAVLPIPAHAPLQDTNITGDVNARQNGSTLISNSATPEYLADIIFSPFSLKGGLPSSPELQTTSKATALEDDLFDDDSRGEFSPVEVLDVRQDASAKPRQKDGGAGWEKPISRTDSGFISAGSSSERSYKPLTKADSGYSSNVSLRSFQAKAQERDLTLSLDKRSSHSTQRTGSLQSQNRSLSNASSTSYSTAPEREAPPPPVPPKDNQPFHNRQKGASETKAITSPVFAGRANEAGLKSPDSLPRTPGSAKSGRSERSISALSLGSGSNKPSKLQRFLSSARRPAAAPVVYHSTTVYETPSPPVAPRAVAAKPQEQSDFLPVAKKRLAPKARPSMDTLKTIFSVNSMETGPEAAKVPRVSEEAELPNEDPTNSKEPSWRDTFQAMPSSIAAAAANVIPRKPVARKPIPPPREAGQGGNKESAQRGSPDSTALSDADLGSYSSASASLGESAYDAGLIAMVGSHQGAPSPEIVNRTLSLNETTLWQLEMRSPGLSHSPLNLNLPSPALPSPLMAKTAASQAKARSSPPVSMITRRPMSLRVPPPLRSQSSAASLRHKASREGIQSYPSTQPLARKTSRDSVRSYPAYGPATTDSSSERSELSPPIPAMDPRRIMAFRHSQSIPHKTPNWDVQTDHDMSRQGSRSNSMHGDRRYNSLPSNAAQAGSAIQRPSSAQAWQVRTAKPQQLKHRASHDGFNMQQRRRQYGNSPSMSNGYTAQPKHSYDPWNSNSQFDPGHGLQDSRYPPYVPRGHHRNRSINHAGSTNVPYRVLHSYNSPAYRGAPIWG
ncbi:hypothetical protein QBC39DRAFT_37974 [Podospora conica]|nr:hypothetical protein QBC39DRAFT_37974 [Schizothecium conicum]